MTSAVPFDPSRDGSLRVGILGGSFDPPHVSHALAALYALAVAPIDAVLVVPVFQHPFAKALAPFEDRVAMCELAMAHLPRVHVSRLEGELGGESLTLRTLEHLQATHPGWTLRLLIGSDVVDDLPKWHRFDRVAELAAPWVIARRSESSHEGVLPEVSSTTVRRLLRARDLQALAPLVPGAVLDHVVARGLYLDPDGR